MRSRFFATIAAPVRTATSNLLSPTLYNPQTSKRTGLVALKKGMTAIWDEWGKLTPVTVMQVQECQARSENFVLWDLFIIIYL
jgi:hypothetical protein